MTAEHIAHEIDVVTTNTADRLQHHVRRRADEITEQLVSLVRPVERFLDDLYFGDPLTPDGLRDAQAAVDALYDWLAWVPRDMESVIDQSQFDRLHALAVDLRLGLDAGLSDGSRSGRRQFSC